MPKKRYSTEDKEEVVHLIMSGAVKTAEVARALGYDQQTVTTWLPKGVDLKQIRDKWVERFIANYRSIPRG